MFHLRHYDTEVPAVRKGTMLLFLTSPGTFMLPQVLGMQIYLKPWRMIGLSVMGQ